MLNHSADTIRMLCAAMLIALLPSLAHADEVAYQVEAESSGNRLEVVLKNHNVSVPLTGITVDAQLPWFCELSAPITTPESIEPDGTSVAVVEFDVPAGVALFTTGDIRLTVDGTTDGPAIVSTIELSLVVTDDAPPLQGMTPVPSGSPLMFVVLALTLVLGGVLWRARLRGEALPR